MRKPESVLMPERHEGCGGAVADDGVGAVRGQHEGPDADFGLRHRLDFRSEHARQELGTQADAEDRTAAFHAAPDQLEFASQRRERVFVVRPIGAAK